MKAIGMLALIIAFFATGVVAEAKKGRRHVAAAAQMDEATAAREIPRDKCIVMVKAGKYPGLTMTYNEDQATRFCDYRGSPFAK